MHPQPSLKIAETFASVQGEGLRQGEPTIFIRLAGCHLRCDFCDAKFAWRGGRPMSAERLIDGVMKMRAGFEANWICLTGGEPLLQDLGDFIGKLKAAGFNIQVETNGTQNRDWPVDWWTVSPKPPRYEYAPAFRRKAAEIKLVVVRKLSYSTIKKLRGEFRETIPLILQPQSNESWSREKAWQLLRRGVKDGLPNLRLGVQLHKIYKLR